MKFDKKLGHLLTQEDYNRIVDHKIDDIVYKLLPLETNDISEEKQTEIVEMIKLSRNKPHICDKVEISAQKLDLFLKERFKTKKITIVRQILALGLKDFSELKPEDLVTRKSPQKKN